MNQFTWDEFISESPSKRKVMWNQLKVDAPDIAEWWETDEGCHDEVDCEYVDNGWCKYMNLPCGVNPYLAPRIGMLGMACMGARPPQQISFEGLCVI